MIKKILSTNNSYSLLILRLVIGIIFFKEGTGKLYAWFGGGGWESTCTYFVNLGIPNPKFTAFMVGYTEFLGGVALFIGAFTRLAAIPIGITMIVAIITAHLKGGWHYPLLITALCIVFVEFGGGALSVDRCLTRERNNPS